MALGLFPLPQWHPSSCSSTTGTRPQCPPRPVVRAMLCNVCLFFALLWLQAQTQEPSNEVNYVFVCLDWAAGCKWLPLPSVGCVAMALVAVGLHLMSSVAQCIEMLSGGLHTFAKIYKSLQEDFTKLYKTKQTNLPNHTKLVFDCGRRTKNRATR